MAGRAPHVVYEYNLDGSYVQSYPDIQSIRRKYYSTDVGPRPIFVRKELDENYHFTPVDTILLKNRIGRDNIRFLIKRVQSEYSYLTQHDDRPVQVFNIRGELLAEYASAYVVSKLLPQINYPTVIRQLGRGRTARFYKDCDLIFKYKEEC